MKLSLDAQVAILSGVIGLMSGLLGAVIQHWLDLRKYRRIREEERKKEIGTILLPTNEEVIKFSEKAARQLKIFGVLFILLLLTSIVGYFSWMHESTQEMASELERLEEENSFLKEENEKLVAQSNCDNASISTLQEEISKLETENDAMQSIVSMAESVIRQHQEEELQMPIVGPQDERTVFTMGLVVNIVMGSLSILALTMFFIGNYRHRKHTHKVIKTTLNNNK